MVPRPWSPGRLSTSTTRAVSTHQNPQMSSPAPQSPSSDCSPEMVSCPAHHPHVSHLAFQVGRVPAGECGQTSPSRGCCPRVLGSQPGPPAGNGVGPGCHRACRPFPRVLRSGQQPHSTHDKRCAGWGARHWARGCCPPARPWEAAWLLPEARPGTVHGVRPSLQPVSCRPPAPASVRCIPAFLPPPPGGMHSQGGDGRCPQTRSHVGSDPRAGGGGRRRGPASPQSARRSRGEAGAGSEGPCSDTVMLRSSQRLLMPGLRQAPGTLYVLCRPSTSSGRNCWGREGGEGWLDLVPLQGSKLSELFRVRPGGSSSCCAEARPQRWRPQARCRHAQTRACFGLSLTGSALRPLWRGAPLPVRVP